MGRNPSAEAAEKRLRALNLRKAGATYDQIAQQVGYANRGTAHKAVTLALVEAQRESQAESHLLDGQRLDQMLMALWPKAMKGDPETVDRVLRIVELRREPEPVEQLGRVAAGVARDLDGMPEELRESALAATALELARNVDNGKTPATCARELRAAMADLAEKAAKVAGSAAKVTKPEEGSLADFNARLAARRGSATG